MPKMSSVFEEHFVQANKAGLRKNQSPKIPNRLIVVKSLSCARANAAAQNLIQHNLCLVYVIAWMEEPEVRLLPNARSEGPITCPSELAAARTQLICRPRYFRTTIKNGFNKQQGYSTSECELWLSLSRNMRNESDISLIDTVSLASAPRESNTRLQAFQRFEHRGEGY
jgi:hypothetical protein